MKRACDACNQRRIKCNLVEPGAVCEGCGKAGLDCTFDKPLKKKGAPGKVLAKLQRQRMSSDQESKTISPSFSNSTLDSGSGEDSATISASPAGPRSHRLDAPPSAHGAWAPSQNPFDTNLFDCGSILGLSSMHGSGASPNQPMLSADEWSSFDEKAYDLGTLPVQWGMASYQGPPLSHPPDQPHFPRVNSLPLPFEQMPYSFESFTPGLDSQSQQQHQQHHHRPSTTMSISLPAHRAPDTARQTALSHAVLPELSIMSVITPSLLRPQIDAFFARMQPVLPIFTRSYVLSRIARHDHLKNVDFAAMILTLASFSLTQLVEGSGRSMEERAQQAQSLMKEATRLQASVHMGENPSLDSILTSFFLFGALFALGQHNAAFFRLREALTLGETLELHRPLSYVGLDSEERGMRVRLFWILSVTERAYAVQRNHTITFRGRPGSSMTLLGPPALQHDLSDGTDPESDSHAVLGLQRLAHLFDYIDEKIVACWNGHCLPSACPTLTVDRLVELHRGLNTDLNQVGQSTPGSGLPSQRSGLSTDVQQADLLVAQQWLRNRVWQLSVTHGLASDTSPLPELRPTYAMSIAHATARVCQSFTQTALEGNGIGLMEKIHDIALTAVHVLHVAGVADGGRANELRQQSAVPELIAILRAFRNGQHPHLQPVVDAWNVAFSPL